MKRLICMSVSMALMLLCGCAEKPDEPAFFCTQEQVSAPAKNALPYDFLSEAKDTRIIVPGLKQNFIPQGICRWDEKNLILISGYFQPLTGNHSAALLAVNEDTGKMAGEYTLTDSAGRDLGGHFSGIAITERDLYITGRRCLYRIPLTVLSNAQPRAALQVAEVISLHMSVDACNYSAGELWVCEYYQAENYPLDGTHKTICADKAVHHAWMVGCAVEDGLQIKCVMSIPDKIQGITKLSDGRFLMSQSYGRANPSAVLIYRDPRTQPPDAVVEFNGESVPLWHLDSRYFQDSLSAPPMSEGCCAAKDGAYFVFESASYYYNRLDPRNRSVHPMDTIWYLPTDKQ